MARFTIILCHLCGTPHGRGPFARRDFKNSLKGETIMKSIKTVLLALCTAALLAGPAMAQSASDANKEYMASMEKMNKQMMEATDPDPAKSFAKKMIVHHQGAIDMSQIVLKHSKDEEIIKMAKKMIPQQEKDIKELKDWLAKH
jgi:hypothetical protein